MLKFLILSYIYSATSFADVKMNTYCKKLDKKFKKYNWTLNNCSNIKWNYVRTSYYGNPIMWMEFTPKSYKSSVILMCGVHPDEITPVKFCFDMIDDLKKNPKKAKDTRVVIAPLVTPDAFLKRKPTRTNARGVDANRNFPTKDWKKDALKTWKHRYKSSKRRYPGKKAASEHETVFQMNLIKHIKPDIIISVHAPLHILDYDGPGKNKKLKNVTKLLKEMSQKAGGYKVASYPFFPGSLGNWAGNERKIPTITLELPNTDWNKTNKYYKQFSPAVIHAFNYKYD
ncbi:MAG: M14 family zinc carboxypeptidase [Bacteriovoracaceae bacterium]|nr:M14 family zinc carboxypeptidase [Bacteriovoracaceae bacterium]